MSPHVFNDLPRLEAKSLRGKVPSIKRLKQELLREAPLRSWISLLFNAWVNFDSSDYGFFAIKSA